ncbi:TetR/AcrR family transcriptional regulator [Vannielia litorea]|uniref:TetR/AcrR family transcriptional regulator n=1 Tax=Vannielia TaxID=2813041 RepID=UPI001C959F20|nr:TetR/AcrR family transcriptional regulator [Vannielia litorea]MBY6048417.1 TetR/AcrR family transcriptional regulator [Vannielia litorea]MBY6075831.1 TetR/AcrR family transcriptional regulator [Vannielia litorea]
MTRAAPYDRETALDAALTLFWRRGFHATSLKDLEAALSMKPGSIYAAFTSKEALFRETLRRYRDRTGAKVATLARESASPLEALAEHARRSGRPEQGRPLGCILVKTVLELADSESEAGEDARHYLAEVRSLFQSLFEKARAAGELPASADCRRLARRFQANMFALAVETLRGSDPEELASLADDIAEEVLRLRQPQ